MCVIESVVDVFYIDFFYRDEELLVICTNTWTEENSGELTPKCTEIPSILGAGRGDLSCVPHACYGIKDRWQSGAICAKCMQLTPSKQQVTEPCVNSKEKLALRVYHQELPSR